MRLIIKVFAQIFFLAIIFSCNSIELKPKVNKMTPPQNEGPFNGKRTTWPPSLPQRKSKTMNIFRLRPKRMKFPRPSSDGTPPK